MLRYLYYYVRCLAAAAKAAEGWWGNVSSPFLLAGIAQPGPPLEHGRPGVRGGATLGAWRGAGALWCEFPHGDSCIFAARTVPRAAISQ